MTDLEWINEEIEHLKHILELDDVLCNLSDKDYKSLKDILNHLQQIKAKLEAWEIVKCSISKEHLEDYQIRTMYGENPFMNLSKGDYEIIKKALEIEDEENN